MVCNSPKKPVKVWRLVVKGRTHRFMWANCPSGSLSLLLMLCKRKRKFPLYCVCVCMCVCAFRCVYTIYCIPHLHMLHIISFSPLPFYFKSNTVRRKKWFFFFLYVCTTKTYAERKKRCFRCLKFFAFFFSLVSFVSFLCFLTHIWSIEKRKFNKYLASHYEIKCLYFYRFFCLFHSLTHPWFLSFSLLRRHIGYECDA